MRNAIKLKQRLSEFDTPNGKVGTGLTVGSNSEVTASNGDKFQAGKFTVLWYERKLDKSVKNGKKYKKYLKRKTIKVDSNRDLAEQIIDGVTRFAGHVL